MPLDEKFYGSKEEMLYLCFDKTGIITNTSDAFIVALRKDFVDTTAPEAGAVNKTHLMVCDLHNVPEEEKRPKNEVINERLEYVRSFMVSTSGAEGKKALNSESNKALKLRRYEDLRPTEKTKIDLFLIRAKNTNDVTTDTVYLTVQEFDRRRDEILNAASTAEVTQ